MRGTKKQRKNRCKKKNANSEKVSKWRKMKMKVKTGCSIDEEVSSAWGNWNILRT